MKSTGNKINREIIYKNETFLNGVFMEKEGTAIVAVIICAVLLLVVAIRRKSEFIINFVLRGILGTITIYLVNQALLWQNLSCLVGINPYTVLTSATLGFPGVILLYGIQVYTLL